MVCGEQNIISIIILYLRFNAGYTFFVDLVNRRVLTLVGEIRSSRNDLDDDEMMMMMMMMLMMRMKMMRMIHKDCLTCPLDN